MIHHTYSGITAFDALNNLDEEECGLMMGRGSSIASLVRLRNYAIDPAEDFAMSVADVRVVESLSRVPAIGTYHTHIGDHPFYPSENDFLGLAASKFSIGAVFHTVLRTLCFFNDEGFVSYYGEVTGR